MNYPFNTYVNQFINHFSFQTILLIVGLKTTIASRFQLTAQGKKICEQRHTSNVGHYLRLAAAEVAGSRIESYGGHIESKPANNTNPELKK